MPEARLHICHLSLLNPAMHSRIFFKMARSQVRAGYRVSIVAQDAADRPYQAEGVEIIPIGVFGRLSWRRLWSSRKIASIAMALDADVYQVHTVELLPMARKLKLKLPRCKVLFDMHEDYVANIRFADYYGELSRGTLAARVQTELDAFPAWGDGLLLAEECFEGLLAMQPGRTAVVRNKYQAPTKKGSIVFPVLNGLPYLLHSGTIAENWGIFRAIELWERLNQFQPLGLVVAGHAQDRQVIATVLERVAASGLRDRFLLAGGDRYLPFEEVVQYIENCTFGSALYLLKENIKDRIPTKFYEYMAHGKPLVFTTNPAWDALNREHPFGISISWPVDESVILKLNASLKPMQGGMCQPTLPEAVWSWNKEAQAMLELIQRVIHP